MPRPHGNKLINRYITKIPHDVDELKKYEVNNDLAEDILNIANGVFSPLKGFMCYNDLENVVNKKRLEDDTPWTIPIMLDSDNKIVSEGEILLLTNKDNNLRALLNVEEIFEFDQKLIAEKVFQTLDEKHPGVSNIYNTKKYFLGGNILLLDGKSKEFEKYHLTPRETRYLFKQKNWKDIVAFQTRNPPHIGHEYVQKTALTFLDGILINPIIGKKKIGDFKDEVILASYETLMKHYFLKERSVMSILRTSMKYAGPREAIHHAIMRKNFGCTHFIVGRDHAGVGNYYGPYDSHDIFSEFPDLGIIPLFFRSFSKCSKCGSVVNDKICPHDQKYHTNFSGKKIREILNKGEIPPEEMMRKEVSETILKFEKPFVE